MSLWKCIKRFFVYHQCSDPDTAFEKRLELFREAERQNMLVEEVIEEVKEEAEDRKLNRNIKKMEEIGFIIDAKTDNVRKELADTREKLFLRVNNSNSNTARELQLLKEELENKLVEIKKLIRIEVVEARTNIEKNFAFQRACDEGVLSTIEELNQRLKNLEPIKGHPSLYQLAESQHKRIENLEKNLEKKLLNKDGTSKKKPGRPKRKPEVV
jgi:hypothetical protein